MSVVKTKRSNVVQRVVAGCLAAGLMVLAAPGASAQPRAGATEIALLGGWEWFGETENLFAAPHFSLRPAYTVTDWLAVEGAFGLTPTELYEPYRDVYNRVTTWSFDADALFHFRPDWWTPYLSAGGGLKLNHEPDADFGTGLDLDLQFGWALGAKFYLAHWIGLRLEARHRIAFDRAPYKMEKIRDDESDGFNLDNTFHNILLMAGVFFQVGARDADGDGIGDAEDRCPEDAEDKDGFQDADGCPDPDNDNDHVLDAVDRCPAAAEDADGCQDADGCPDLDNDADGVLDVADLCPEAPEMVNGVQDEDGCPEGDADGDAILDPVDKCPHQPEDADGFQDADGCPDTDNDGDGIPDERDAAPDAAETVNGYLDEDGAPDEIPEKLRAFAGRIEGIHFALGSSDLTAPSMALLRKAAVTLKQYPDLKLEVQGHTDARGDRQLNVDLSRKRAESVMTYLHRQGIPGDLLTAVGYGPDRPVDPAENEEAWAKNRRVEFRLHK